MSWSCGTPSAAKSSARAGAAVRTAARSLAERARGLAATSASEASIAPRVSRVKVGGSDRASGRCRDPRATWLRSCRKRLTMRSSSEWKATTTRRPPSLSTASAAPSACASSSSSRLMKMRSAWNVRVAGWMRDAPAGPAARAMISASCAVLRIGCCCRAAFDGAGDAPRLLFFAVDADDRRQIACRCVIDERSGVGAAPSHAHVERPVEAEREPAFRLVELHRGDADVEHHAVNGCEVPRAGVALEVGEATFDQPETPARRFRQCRTSSERRRIAVDRQHPTAALEDRPAVSAPAEGAVDVAAARHNAEVLQHLGQEDRHVAGRSASIFRRSAARAHAVSPLPGWGDVLGLERPSPRVSERRCERVSR